MPTNLPQATDAPRTFGSNFRVDATYLASLEAQLQALGAECVRLRNQTWTNAYVQADPDGSALDPGTAVALKTGTNRSILVPASYSAVVLGGAALLGVLTETAAPGAMVNVATSGVLPSSVTGLGALTGKAIRANPTTGKLEAVTALGASDIAIGLGRADGAVALQLHPLGHGGGLRVISFELDYADLTGLAGGQKTYEFNPLYPGNVIPAKGRIVGFAVSADGFVGFDDGAAGVFTLSLSALATADVMGDVDVSVGETGFPKAGAPGALGFPGAQPGLANAFATLTGTNDLKNATVGHLTGEILVDLVGG